MTRRRKLISPRRRMNRRGTLALLSCDRHLPTHSLFPLPLDSPCPPSPSQTPTSPPTGSDASPPRAVPTTSTTPPAPPPGSSPAARTLFLPVPSPVPLRHRQRRRPPTPPPPFRLPHPPLPPRPPRILSPYPKDGRNARPQTAALTLSTTTPELQHGTTHVSPTHRPPCSLPPPRRPPLILGPFPLDGRCA